MDDALYRLHAEREETYWWWVAKNRIILSLVERYGRQEAGLGLGAAGATSTSAAASTGSRSPASGSDAPRPCALDIGCGAGALLTALSSPPFGYHVTGIDMSPIARAYCKKRGFDVLDGALPDQLPAAITSRSPARGGAGYDLIVLSEVIEHVPEDRASIAACVDLLKPGGLVVCTVPAHMWLWSSHDDFNFHQRRYTRAGFGALFEGLPVHTLVLSYYQLASMPLVVAARAAEKLRTRISGRAPSEPAVEPLPGPVNWVLTKAFEVEKHILPHVRLPSGTSVIAAYRRV